MLKKINFIIGSTVLLQSCAIDTTKIAPGYVEAFRTIKNTFVEQENKLISPELIENIPYASMSLRIGRGAPGLLILESVDLTKETWVSADGVFLLIKDGRVIESSGLFNNLKYFRSPDIDFNKIINKKGHDNLIYYYSYDKPKLNDMKVEVERSYVRIEKVSLVNQDKDLHLIEEKIHNDYIGWRELNRFWVDDKGFVWKSEQHISPKLPVFKIEITKKPAY